jgi:hypothetical protein
VRKKTREWRLDFKMIEQIFGAARVLRRHQIHLFQYPNPPECHVLEISDRR